MQTLKLISPLMRGASQLQRDCNARLRHWGVAWHVTVDDQYGPATKRAVESVCFGLGIPQEVLLHGVSPHTQDCIRDPAKHLSRAEKHLRDQREAWRKRLVKHFAGPHGVDMAVSFARRMAERHITEQPPGSNRGPYIDNWNRAVGTPPGPYAYWCGAFANACLVAAGFPNQQWLRYCPWIEAHARGGIDGWSWHSLSNARRGDLALYTERNVAGHVEILLDAKPFTTVGGNTSADAGSGSQSNGGGVFLRHRDPHYSGFPVRGVARPPYAHVK